jgi:hypothetical protein
LFVDSNDTLGKAGARERRQLAATHSRKEEEGIVLV